MHASTTTRARLYYDTCAPLHRPVCMYTFATRMTMLRTLQPGGSRLSGTSLPAKIYLVGPSSQWDESFFYPDALPCVRRCSCWVPAVRGANRFFARMHFLACEGAAGGSQQSGGNVFFAKYGGPSGGSPLSGGGIIILHVKRRHFLAATVDRAVSLSTYSPRPMEAVP